MTKAIIFDFDGVLVDSERYWPSVMRRIFEEHASHPWTDEDCRSMTGYGLEACHERCASMFGMRMSLEEFREYLLRNVETMYATRVELMPGTRSLLDRLDASKVPKGIGSSNRTDVIEAVIKRLGIDRYFRSICSSDDVGARVKPLPDVYLLAAEHLGVDPRRCVVIEDSSAGIAAANAAGMRSIALRTIHNDHQDLSEADAHIGHFDELTHDRLASLLG